MKLRYEYYLVFIVMIGLLCGNCTQKKDKSKIEYNGKLKYFTDRNGLERGITKSEINKTTIILPECFEVDYRNNLSISDEFVYFCNKNATYITIDRLNNDEIKNKTYYLDAESIQLNSNSAILLEYVLSKRQESMMDGVRSVWTETTTDYNKKILLGSIKGRYNKYSDNLYYQFGIIEFDEECYVLQAIISVDNTPFLIDDILTIFKSFEKSTLQS